MHLIILEVEVPSVRFDMDVAPLVNTCRLLKQIHFQLPIHAVIIRLVVLENMEHLVTTTKQEIVQHVPLVNVVLRAVQVVQRVIKCPMVVKD